MLPPLLLILILILKKNKSWKLKFKPFNYCVRKKEETEEQVISSPFLSSQVLFKNLKVLLTVLPSCPTSKGCPRFIVLVPWKPKLRLFFLNATFIWLLKIFSIYTVREVR